MANKGRIGNAYHYSQKRINRLIDKIDKREAKGTNRENIDSTYRKCSFTANGERVWSF